MARASAVTDITPARRPSKFVVGVGASAGGMKALGTLLKNLDPDFSAPIVAVIHLDPSHPSQLAPLLQRETKLTVEEARSGQVLVPGHVYVASPGLHLEVHGHRLRLTRAPRVRFSRPSVDRLFSSLAKSHHEHAIAVILSGTGSDGTAGAQDVKANGGFVIVQRTATAEFAAMPESAVRAGIVDLELPIEKIGAALADAIKEPEPGALPPQWNAVLAMLRQKFGTDFGGYRHTTLMRRLDRRIAATGHKDLKSYLASVRRDPSELGRLHSEFLIKVSSFFRDAKEWDSLQRKVVRPLVEKTRDSEEIRVWSVGCATGQEPYSLAIMFREALRKRPRVRFKVFATDIDERALATSRVGRYDAQAVAGLPPRLRSRYFVRVGDGWQAKKDLRQHVIFGRHDLLRDAPLASMDLIVCRNVMIYFTPEQSRPAVQRLAYALRPGGFLFLGRSENRRFGDKNLERVPGVMRIFRRSATKYQTRHAGVAGPSGADQGFSHEMRRGKQAISDELAFRNLLLDTATLILFGVDPQKRVILWNKAAEAFFGVHAAAALGHPASDVVGADVWDKVKRAVQEVGAGSPTIRVPKVTYRPAGRPQRFLDFDCLPFRQNGPTGPSGVLFIATDSTERWVAESMQAELMEELRKAAQEARDANEAAQAVNEELETLNEELQSTSEEQQTLNEELESRNEELETVNEELQSLNEELSTLNEEVGSRIAEGERINAYLRTVLDLSPDALIGCDTDHRVTLWNLGAREIFRLSEDQAVGREIFDLLPALDVPAMHSLLSAPRPKGAISIHVTSPRPQPVQVRVRVVRDAGERRQGFVIRVIRPTPAETPESEAKNTGTGGGRKDRAEKKRRGRASKRD